MLQTILVVMSLVFIPLFIWLSLRLYSAMLPIRHLQSRIRQYSRNYLYDKHYRLVENVCIRSRSGESLLIPQVLVSRFGIYIMGACDARGRIYGNNSITWWYIRKGKWFYPFDNPHDQLRYLSDDLASYLMLPDTMCQTVVVFDELAKFNHKNYQQTGYLNEIINYITWRRPGYLSSEEFNQIISKLENSLHNITSDAKRCIIETGKIAPAPVSQ